MSYPIQDTAIMERACSKEDVKRALEPISEWITWLLALGLLQTALVGGVLLKLAQ